MKTSAVVILLLAFLGLSGYVIYDKNFRTGGGGNSLNSASSPSFATEDGSDAPPPGAPWDYFPTDTGHRWSYKITLFAGRDSLNHGVIDWPLGGDRGVSYETRGRYLPDGTLGAGDTYRLVIHIKGPAQKQGPMDYPEGYELSVDKDDLGIFGDTTHVYWAITKSARYQVNLVTTYSPNSPGAPSGGPWGSSYGSDGSSTRLFFFGEKPGIGIGLHGENDELEFMGPINYNGRDALLFVRKVDKGTPPDHVSDTDDILDKAFTEEMIFVRGLGLVHLIQKVGSNPTMIWDLDDGSTSSPSTPSSTTA